MHRTELLHVDMATPCTPPPSRGLLYFTLYLDVVRKKAVQPCPGGPELVDEGLHPMLFAHLRRVSSGNHPLQGRENAPEEHSEYLKERRSRVQYSTVQAREEVFVG